MELDLDEAVRILIAFLDGSISTNHLSHLVWSSA